MHKKRIVFFSCCFLGLSSFVSAETGKWSIGLHPGWGIPTGKTKDSTKNSFALDASADCQLTNGVSAGLELGYSFGHKLKGTFPVDTLDAPFTSNIKTAILQVTPVIKLSISQMKFHPYVLAGAGLYHLRQTSGKVTFTGRTSGGVDLTGISADVESSNNSYFGMNGGVGFLYGFTDNFQSGVDVRYHQIFAPDDDAKYFLPSLRLNYVF